MEKKNYEVPLNTSVEKSQRRQKRKTAVRKYTKTKKGEEGLDSLNKQRISFVRTNHEYRRERAYLNLVKILKCGRISVLFRRRSLDAREYIKYSETPPQIVVKIIAALVSRPNKSTVVCTGVVH